MSQSLNTESKLEPSIIFTDNAATKVQELIEEEDNKQSLYLRVYITGGGCSGFQYGFTFDQEIREDDLIISKTIKKADNEVEVSLLIDPLSYQYLHGAEIDYREDLKSAEFVIHNPNATTTCGCGSSFSL